MVVAKKAGERNDHRVGDTQAPDWKLWCLWVLASVAAGAVATPLLYVYVGSVTEVEVGGISAMGGLLLMPGVVLGALQLLVLRRQVTVAGVWVLVTALGWIVGWALGVIAGVAVAEVVAEVVEFNILQPGSAGEPGPWGGVVIFGVGGAIAGLVMGGLQGRVLRTHAARTVVWVRASSVAMAVGGVWVGVVTWGEEGAYVGWSAVIASLLYGAITGYGLMLLLRQSGADARDSTTEDA